MEWIKCSEKMPEDDSKIIGYSIEDGIMVMQYYKDYNRFYWSWSREDSNKIRDVTHWMIIPEPPKCFACDKNESNYCDGCLEWAHKSQHGMNCIDFLIVCDHEKQTK